MKALIIAMPLLFVVPILLIAIFATMFTLYAFPLVRVMGSSMYPTYRGGELLRGARFYPREKLKDGDVICFYDTDQKDHVVIKRIASITTKPEGLFFYCLGDNPDHSHDSRHYGAIHESRIVCIPLDQRKKNA